MIEKGSKVSLKCGKNYRGFSNRLEVLRWHENNSVVQFRGINEVHEFLPPNGNWNFIAKYRQMTPRSTRKRMYIIFMILTNL